MKKFVYLLVSNNRKQCAMKRIVLISIIILVASFISNAQQCDSCKLIFDKLLDVLEQGKINQTELQKCWQITSDLHLIRYTNYIDSVVNKATYVSHSLTKTYSDICIKAGDSIGVKYYFKYLTLTIGSVEEERSFALERLFVKYPEITLKQIGNNEELLNSLAWGFLNNRYYGAKNPFENEDYSAMTVYENGPKPILNMDNCKDIFFETNPSLKNKYSTYKYQIDFIINSAKSELFYSR